MREIVSPPIAGETFYDTDGNPHTISSLLPYGIDENGGYFTVVSLTYNPGKTTGIRWNNSRWEVNPTDTLKEYPYATS